MRKTIDELRKLLSERILVLDGAMGTMLQAGGLTPGDFNRDRFAAHPVPLQGDNDVLCLTRPDAVKRVHKAYLDAGADIIETNTFGANAISQSEYQLADAVYDIAFAGARIARETADEAEQKDPGKPRFVAGSIGPTGKTASISPSVEDPAVRNVTFDELAAAYQTQMEGLYDGGADLFLIETAFDTLNVKAAIYAAEEVMRKKRAEIPVMISATLSDASGRMLAGQSAEAFLISVLHTRSLLSVGFNCALGPDEIRAHVAALSAAASVFVSTHPNAGLPDVFGNYVQTPERMSQTIRSFAEQGIVNIVGGCCGTTPAHIAAIARAVENLPPRRIPEIPPALRLAGLDPFVMDENSNFIHVGERTNVAGSRKFLRLIQSDDLPGAMLVARTQIENGASVIDVNMDDPMLDAPSAMKRFLLYAASEPDIARVPVMIDSSNWEVVRTALRCIQGKPIVNSISLKEGEAAFLEKADEIRRLGAAVLVMAFDEQGQADTCSRRVEILSRSYALLTQRAGFRPEDIVFDPNVFAVATGIREHDNYAADFIASVSELHKRFPRCGISGGISNVSFSFRGNDAVRGAIHTVFLKHAIDAGLSMGIVNAGQLELYDDLDPELRDAAERVVLNTDPGAAEHLLEIASRFRKDPSAEKESRTQTDAWRTKPLAERIAYSLVKGDDSFAEQDMAEALAAYPSPMKIVEGPLMDGMKEVGERFSSGRMFLPQVVKSARVMKRSVACLMPAIEKVRETGGGAPSVRMVLATVKGDVHDIGKNIVSVVMQCNDCAVTDLGVMVPAETIVDKAVEIHADLVGLSGLITPSLAEMACVAKEMERRHLTIPLLLGGAAASELHTALKLQILYSGPVVYVKDASAMVPVVSALMSPEKRGDFLKQLSERYAYLRKLAEEKVQPELLPLPDAREKAGKAVSGLPARPKRTGIFPVEYDAENLSSAIDWDLFARTWGTPDRCCCTQDLIRDARLILEKCRFRIRAVCGIFPANAEEETIHVYADESRKTVLADLPTLRGQTAASGYRAAADFIADAGTPDWIGMGVVSVSGAGEFAAKARKNGDDYSALLAEGVANMLAEAGMETLHRSFRREWYVCTGGIRPAPGYPDLPEHSLKEILFRLLSAEEHTGAHLTENWMMDPESSVCALMIAEPGAKDFHVGRIDDEQKRRYCRLRGISAEALEKSF